VEVIKVGGISSRPLTSRAILIFKQRYFDPTPPVREMSTRHAANAETASLYHSDRGCRVAPRRT